MSDFELDPERKLWKPNRRGFLSMFSAAIVASVLPDLPKIGPENLLFKPDAFLMRMPWAQYIEYKAFAPTRIDVLIGAAKLDGAWLVDV